MDYREIVQRSLDYIEDNLKAEIRPEELAEMAGFSLYHYYRLFRSETGLPVMQYVLRRRLLHGIYAIKQGSSGIDAALTYGFDTYAGFYKAFRREFGCTPSAFLQFSRAKRPYRLNLNKEEYMNVTHKKAKEILKHWNLENETVSDIYCDGTGSRKESAFYVGDQYVLKFSTNLGKLKNHAALSKAMERIGLWAAAPVAAADGREFVQDGEAYYCLTRRLQGSQMAAEDFYGGNGGEDARFVGEIIGQLHLALEKSDQWVGEENLLETVKNWALPKAAEALKLEPAFCKAYITALEELHDRLPRQIIHRDPNPGNIIRGDAGWGFLDFELSQRNVRIYDPCYAATAIISETFGTGDRTRLEVWPEIYQNILLGYDSVVSLTPEERQAAPYVLLANQLVCVAWFAEQEKYAELLETNKQMTWWLLEWFDTLKLDN